MAKKKTTRKKAKPARAKAAKKSAAKRSAKKPARAKAASGLQLTSIAPSLTVNDLAQSMTFYCDILGFTVQQKWENEGEVVGAELRAGTTALYIGRDDWKMGRDRIKGQGVRLYWYTDQDIDKLAAAIKAKGGTLASEPKEEWGMRFFNLEDPTGYKITVGSNR
jgi:uncharacterized glyoxalase superfamily protein PhnB